MTLDNWVHVTELAGFVGGAVMFFRRIDRFFTLFEDFPPHRHVNGNKILYPKGWKPPEVERVNGESDDQDFRR